MERKGYSIDKYQQVAIVGIGCRYGHGVNNVRKFWKMLEKGLDCTTPIPPDRFDASYFLSPGEKTIGKMYIQKGGYISQDPYMFDRQFFKMPPDEAAHLDPQVRLLLEVTWEALENAGIPASSVRGSKTGVYMGVTAQEYTSFTFKPFHNINQYSNSGTNSCMVSNRISYEFDLRGPSFAVDTACSSSLYSVHLACEALKRKSCSMALAGGVNLILTPNITIGFCQAGMLSGDGKCKSFDQAANGYSRSEGAGVLVLKPLDEALRNGDRVYAVLRGGALSNDGRTPGIANPSFVAQVDLVKSACQNAGVDPHDIIYAEAHGTGTRAGDTTEAGALGEVMGRGRGSQHPPFYIGSVKSNLGHSEGAAGVAGIIKVALCLYQRKIPPVVHFRVPNENVDFEALKIHIPTKLTSWPSKNHQPLACCSSFGFGGANANLVLEGPIPLKDIRPSNFKRQGKMLTCLLLSAASPDALSQSMKDWVDFLTEDSPIHDVAFYSYLYTAACRSQHHSYRVGFAVDSKEGALHHLRMKLEGETDAPTRCVEGVASSTSDTAQPVVFVFSGMGTQWWGMARELMHTQPVFASKMKVIDKILLNCGTNWSLVSMLSQEQDCTKIHQTEISQPCLFAVAIGLLDLWKMRGVIPDAVVGHSVGEVAAAYAAGLLSLEHGVKLIYRRGRELRKTSGSGKMVAVLHRVEDALSLAENSRHGQLLDVAAINSPGQVVFSGDSFAVEGLANEFKTKDIKCVILKVNNSFHSKQQDVVKSTFLKKVGKFLKIQNAAGRTNTIPMMSTVTGRYLTVEEANSPEYWFQNVRQKVSFMSAIQKLAKDGYRVFVEIGPHTSLLPALRDVLADFQGAEGKFVTTGSLVRPKDTNTLANDSENLLLSQMMLHVNGIAVEFDGLFDSTFRRVVSIPHYPWQRERCTNITKEARKAFLFPVAHGHHLLLGEPRESFYLRESPVKIWRADLNASSVPWVKDHVLQGAVVVPAAAYTETALAAARALFGDTYPLVLSDITYDRFMFAPDSEGCLESTVEEKAPDRFLFTLRSHDVSRGKWTQHCHLNIIPPSAADFTEMKLPDGIVDVESVEQRCTLTLSGDDFYKLAIECGFQLGPTFRGVQKISVTEDYQECLLYAEAPSSVQREFHRYVYHPAFMDSLLQAFAVLLFGSATKADQLSGKTSQPVYRVPRSIKIFAFLSKASPRVFMHLRMKGTGRSYCDIKVGDAETRKVFCSVREVEFETIQTNKIEPQMWSTFWNNLGSTEITEGPMNTSAPAKKVLIFADDPDIHDSLVVCLNNEGDLDVTVLNKEANATEEAKQILSENTESDTLLVIMKTEVAGACLNTESVMSQTEFEECQDKGPLFLYSVFKSLLSEGLKPKLLLFTRGAYRAKEDDEINPFATILTTVGITVSHEEPSIRGFNVDLPLTASSLECAQIAKEVIYKEESLFHDENCVAVRRLTGTENAQQNALLNKWVIMSPRLKMTNISQSPGVVPTTEWSLEAQTVSDRSRIFVQTSQPRTAADRDGDAVRVKVEAFTVYRQISDGKIDSSSLLCLYSGEAEGFSDVKNASGRVLGLTKCRKVGSYMAPTPDDLTNVPSFLTSEEAVNIAKDHLPSAVFFDQALAISSGMRLLFNLESLDGDKLAAVHLAKRLGAEAMVLVDGHDSKDLTKLDTFVRCVKSEVDEASVDVLFLSVRPSSLAKTMHTLLPKLKRSGTVVMIQKLQQHMRLPMLPPKMKMVIFDAYLPSAVNGLTSAEISHVLCDLWDLFDPNTICGPSIRGPRKCKKLSSYTAANEEIPQDEVITVGAGELLLPLSLGVDGFVAEAKATYFITGGTRGLGLKLIEWLVSRGARYIYTGSRGKISSELQVVIQQARKVGAQVQHIRMDVTNAADVERALRSMNDGHQNWPGLKGIFHCAVVFNDAFLHNVTAETWNTVMAPKAYGALLLHQLTLKLGIQLDYFIMTSSIVSLIGNAGQGSYCAANVFLNALSEFRHRRGLPATAVQIGVINDVGFAMRRGLVQEWEKTGVGSLSPSEVLGSIGCALLVRQPQLGISGSFNRQVYAERHRGLMVQHFREKQGTMSVIKDLFHNKDAYLTQTNDTLLQSIVKLPPAKAREIVTDTLSKLLSKHLQLTDDMPSDVSLISLGLDSLMASEVSQMISQQFEVGVGAVDLLNDRNTVNKLGKNITKDLLAKADLANENFENDGSTATTQRKLVVEGKAPKSVGVKMVCFPSNGAGPSLFASWIQPLLQHGIQLLMIQLPGWEGREDEKPLTNIDDITRAVHDELLAHLSGTPFVFFSHSMGSLIAFEVAHLLLAEDNIRLSHFFASAWYPPQTPYPHPKELIIKPATFERLKETLQNQPKMFVHVSKLENVSFSFLDKSSLSNVALMRRLLPCIEAAFEMLKAYKCNHKLTLSCDITVLGGKQDHFVPHELLDGWETQKSRGYTFKKITYQGKHMFLLTNTEEVVKEVRQACLNAITALMNDRL